MHDCLRQNPVDSAASGVETKCDHVDAVRFLVKDGADVPAKDKDKWTPLHLASHSDVVMRFLIS